MFAKTLRCGRERGALLALARGAAAHLEAIPGLPVAGAMPSPRLLLGSPQAAGLASAPGCALQRGAWPRSSALLPAPRGTELAAGIAAIPAPGMLRVCRNLSAEAGATEAGTPDAAAEAVDSTKLYVGNLPWNVDSATLAQVLQEAGGVEEVEVMCDRDTGRSRGFAFVVMSSPEDVKAAIDRFNGSELGGRLLKVGVPAPPGQRPPRSTSPRTPRPGGPREESPFKLYVGNLAWGIDDHSLGGLFAEAGTVVDARVITDRQTGRSRGFGFVTLSSEEEVARAIADLSGTDLLGRQIRVNRLNSQE